MRRRKKIGNGKVNLIDTQNQFEIIECTSSNRLRAHRCIPISNVHEIGKNKLSLFKSGDQSMHSLAITNKQMQIFSCSGSIFLFHHPQCLTMIHWSASIKSVKNILDFVWKNKSNSYQSIGVLFIYLFTFNQTYTNAHHRFRFSA